jgi:hypothetical protein
MSKRDKFSKTEKWIILCIVTGLICLCASAAFYMTSRSVKKEEVQEASPVPSPTPSSTPRPTATPAVTPSPSATATVNVLEDAINTYLRDNDIDESCIGIYVHDLTDDSVYTLNADQYFIAASTYKLPLAMYYYEQINDGNISLDQIITLRIETDDSDTDTSSEDSSQEAALVLQEDGTASPLPAVSEAPTDSAEPSPSEDASSSPEPEPTAEAVYYTSTVEDALHSMIQYSDNIAAEALYENLGGFGPFKRDIMKYSNAFDESAPEFYDNEFTPKIMNDILQYAYEHQSSFSALMADLLMARPYDYLNGNRNGVMYQKYGNYGWANNAVGFPSYGNPYTIAIYTYGLADGVQVIADINEICFEYYNPIG